MPFSIDARELARERAWAENATPKVRTALWTIVRKGSFFAERNVKLRMPVDTGRARASWGHATAPASPADGIWIEQEGQLTLTQGTRVEYVQYLNEGSSQQAPAGFIDAVEIQAANYVDGLIDELMEAWK